MATSKSRPGFVEAIFDLTVLVLVGPTTKTTYFSHLIFPTVSIDEGNRTNTPVRNVTGFGLIDFHMDCVIITWTMTHSTHARTFARSCNWHRSMGGNEQSV